MDFPDWLIDAWTDHGEAIARAALGSETSRDDLMARTGLGDHRYRRLVRAIRDHGVRPPDRAIDRRRARDRRLDSVAAGSTHLVIGDAHAVPGEDRWRFRALGRMIADLRPDVVVEIGDWFDMPSLSSYDRGKVTIEGKRVLEDIRAGSDALADLMREWRANDGAPFRGVRVQGNHGQRVDRWMEETPAAYGLLDDYDGAFRDQGWEVSPFLVPVEIDGVSYCHYFHGHSGRPMGAKHLGAQLIRERHHTCVVGHSHRLDHYTTSAGSRRLHGLSVGCYTDAIKGYARQSNDEFWRGIVVLRDVRDGDFDLETYSIDRIRRTWGDDDQ